jgi:YtkA-like
MKNFFFLLSILLPVAFSIVEARTLTLSARAGNYEVEMSLDRNPPIVGDNQVEIVLKDLNGRRVTGAQVLVNYYMPPMPRMAPMNYRTNANLKGDKYQASMNFIMAGPWIIAVKISAGGKMTSAKFNIDVP